MTACQHSPTKSHPRLSPWAETLRRGLALFRSALSEIFDESAYARFLARRQLTCSRESYGAFLREHEFTKARRPHCC